MRPAIQLLYKLKKMSCNIGMELSSMSDASCETSMSPPAVKKAKLSKQARKEQLSSNNERPVYYFENGLRKVQPYYFTFTCYAKRRWLGRKLLEVLNSEFHPRSPDFFLTHFKKGRTLVNRKLVSEDYEVRDLDLIENTAHRHELPIKDSPIRILKETEELLAVDKPASMPVHPCGRYNYNSVTSLLRWEYGYSGLRSLYRLDRATSGVLVFAKNLKTDQELKRLIAERRVQKEYVCKVEGEFPEGLVVCDRSLQLLVPSMGVQVVSDEGKQCLTRFRRLASGDGVSILSCFPETGRTHQIRVHLQYLGYPIINDVIYNDEESFGPTKGRAKEFGKSLEELGRVVGAQHSFEHWHPAQSASVSDRADMDPDCPDCRIPAVDPSPQHLEMYLHCLRYTTPDCTFETELPDWARLS